MAGYRFAHRLKRAPLEEGPSGIARGLVFLLRPLAIVLAGSCIVPAQESPTVEWKAGRLSVSAAGAPLADVLREVALRSGVEVQGLESLRETVSVRFARLTLREGLEELLTQRDYIILGDLSRPAGEPPVRVIVMGPRRSPPPVAAAADTAVEDAPIEADAEAEEPGSEIAVPEDEPPAEVSVEGEDGSAAEEEAAEIAAGQLATATPEGRAGADETTASDVVGAPPTETADDSSAMEELGAQIAVVDHEPESEVEIIGEDEGKPD